MINIYAQSLMTASRLDTFRNNQILQAPRRTKRWLPKGHWWLKRPTEK